MYGCCEQTPLSKTWLKGIRLATGLGVLFYNLLNQWCMNVVNLGSSFHLERALGACVNIILSIKHSSVNAFLCLHRLAYRTVVATVYI